MIPVVRKLQVLYHGIPVGLIQSDPTSGACTFEYDRKWLSDGFSISPTELPLKSDLFLANADKFGGGFATFEDSLPDGYGLYLLDRILKKQKNGMIWL